MDIKPQIFVIMLVFLAIGVSYVCPRISAFFILGHSHPWVSKMADATIFGNGTYAEKSVALKSHFAIYKIGMYYVRLHYHFLAHDWLQVGCTF